jgi:hypothetical protein
MLCFQDPYPFGLMNSLNGGCGRDTCFGITSASWPIRPNRYCR